MQQIIIKENESGQRMNKFLHKYMPLASDSFIYRMLRKKNITLNGKKAAGNEKLNVGDVISFYLSDETINNFTKKEKNCSEYETAYQKLNGIEIVYEDDHIILMNKPAGILSQKAQPADLSLNEWMIGYLLSEKDIDLKQLATFKPSICNRLDRNTMGLVTGAKSLAGSQKMNQLIKNRTIKKFYRMLVKGQVQKEEILEGFLLKDEENNKVRLVKNGPEAKASYIKTRYYPIKVFSDKTLVEAELITGKSHQIRIHLAGAGHPLLGDYKYGDRKWNDKYKRAFQVNSQLLYANRLEFPRMDGCFQNLSEKIIEAPVPEVFRRLMDTERNS